METHEITKSRVALQNAGTPADKNQLRATLISRLENDVERLQQRKATVRADYRRKLERWRTESVPENVAVCAVPSDVHDTRLYRATALFALLSEMALAAWVFFWQGVVWWIGAVTALGVTMTLHGIFLHVFDNQERPKETVYRIRKFVSLPAIFGFLVALALGVLARYVRGPLAVMLLPAFSFALWLGTLSLLILAASLFTIAHIQGWSARHERQYRKADAEEQANSAFLEELRADENMSDTPAVQPKRPIAAVATASAAGAAGTRAAGFLACCILTAALFSNTGCTTANTSAKAVEAQSAAAAQAASLHVFVDTSGSCVRPALEESWQTVRRELPEIIERHGITTLAIWQFDEDGWSPRRIHDVALPALRVQHGSRRRTRNGPASPISAMPSVRAKIQNGEGEWG